MSHRLILLTGSTAAVIPPVPDNEPYRVIWNSIVIMNDEDTYISGSGLPLWKSKILNTAVLTHHDTEPAPPVLYSSVSAPFDTTMFGQPVMLGMDESGVSSTNAGYTIPDIHRIAYPDRRGKLPKVFQVRVVANHRFDSRDLFKYQLDANRNYYVAMGIHTHPNGDLYFELKHRLGEGNEVTTGIQQIPGLNIQPMQMTDSIRFVIFEDRIAIYYDDPGIEVLSMPLPGPLVIGKRTELLIGAMRGITTDLIYGIDGIYIYDGYF